MDDQAGETKDMTSKDDASIQERQVTVRVLTIGTKQVTQTMYKQLQDDNRSLFDEETGILSDDAVIWGWVNLCDPQCKQRTDVHIHVIYEHNGRLKKAIVSRAYLAPGTLGRDIKDRFESARRLKIKDLAEAEADYLEYVGLWTRTFKAIEDAGQLFIAVSGVWK